MKQELDYFRIGNSYGGNQDWFLLTGYKLAVNMCMIKAVTYGTWHWLDLEELWDTGCKRKGGLVLYH